jgi:hypothetical protein
MKRYLSFILLLALMLSIFGVGHAQTTVTIGDGTANNYLPIYPWYNFSYSQTIYLQSDINVADQRIENIAFYWNGATVGTNSCDWVVYMAHTDKTAFSGATDWVPYDQLTQVFAGALELPATPGWVNITLHVPFIYNNTDNLLIAVDENTGGNSGSSAYFHSTSVTGTRALIYYSDGTNPDPSDPPGATMYYSQRNAYANIKLQFGDLPTTPVCSLNPTEWDFGRHLINTTGSKTFTIRNIGIGTLNVTGISPTADGFFSVVNAPAWPVALATGQTATFDIQYAPTAGGNHTATFAVAYDGGTADVNVSGEGLDPNITSFPYLQDFDGAWTGTPAAPLAWTVINADDDGYTWRQSSQYIAPTHSEPFAAHGMGNTDDWLITPPIVLGSEAVRMKWWDKVESSNNINSYKVYVSTTTPEIASFTTELADINCANTAWTEHMLSLGAYAGQTIYVAFHQYASPSAWYGFGIDDFVLEYMPTAAAAPILVSPADGAINLPKTGFDLTWEPDTSGLIPASYAVYLATDVGTIYDEYRWETANTSFNPVTEGGVTFEYSQRWYWTVAAIDGADEVPQETPRFFDIEANPIVSTYPWTEDFDDVALGDMPLNWTMIDSGAGGWVAGSNIGPHSQPMCAIVYYHGTLPKNEWMITNPFSMQAGQAYNISFAVKGAGWGGVPENLAMYWGTEPTIASMTANPALFDNNNTSYSAWTFESAMFTPTTTGLYYFGWHAYSPANLNYIAVDDITISEVLSVDLAAVAMGGDVYGYINMPVEKTVSVRNLGLTEQSNYTVYLKEEGTNNVLAQELITDTIAINELKVHTLSWTPAATGTVTVYAEVALTGDQNAENNVTAAAAVPIFAADTEELYLGNPETTWVSWAYPFNVYYQDFVAETVYLASEIQAENGEIQGIAYYNYFQNNVNATVQIWMQNTDATDVSTAWLPWENYTLVYDGPVFFPSGSNEIVVSFTTPFNYTGGNLGIRTSRTWVGDEYSSYDRWWITEDPNYPGRTRFYYADGSEIADGNPAEAGSGDHNPNVQLFMISDSLVETLPAPVVNATESATGFELNWELIPYAYNYNVYVSADPYDYSTVEPTVVYTNTYEMDTTADKNFYKVTANTYRDYNRAQVVLRNLNPREVRSADDNLIGKPEKKAQRFTK